VEVRDRGAALARLACAEARLTLPEAQLAVSALEALGGPGKGFRPSPILDDARYAGLGGGSGREALAPG
jgi:hypothetical protein